MGSSGEAESDRPRRGMLGLVASSAGGVEALRTELVEPAIARGWQVGVTLTPTAARWLDAHGEVARLAEVTGLTVRTGSRLPTEFSPHPTVDCYVVAPATTNTVAKLALGISDNQGVTQVNEAIGGGTVPVVVFPLANAATAGHPAWAGHLDTLRRAGVHLVYGEEIWPLRPPKAPPDRPIPWSAVLDAVDVAVASR